MPTHVALGVRPTVVVLTRAELAQVVADNPFPDEPNPRWVHAIFRNGSLGPDELAAVAAAQQRAQDQGSDDEARVIGTTLFLHTPGGLGRSELAAQLTRLGSLPPPRDSVDPPPPQGRLLATLATCGGAGITHEG